jgi:cellulose synthase/poly-beta-1,6-N-acetylglucosamine synthase-like glycosyltransferase
MLTRLLFLAASWLILAAVPTMLAGTRLRRGSIRLSLAWLIGVVALGDVWALYAFATPEETAVLSLLVLVAGWWWIRRLPDWNALGQVTWSMMLCTTLLYIVYSFAVTAFTPLQPVAFLIAVIFYFFEMAALLLALTFTFETLDVACRLKWNRPPQPPDPVDGYFPKVSLHVPAYNEPTDVVEATLRTLARLDYPNYEVLLIDNNTPDEATWRPLEAVCRELGPHFHCLHLDNWPGYKSGALNFALAQTAPDAEIVGVVDADYQVQPEYLRELVPAFTDPQIAFVQTPQDYRDYGDNPFLEACYHAYKYFFEITMSSRNERNAAIFGGTMGLIRTSVLREIGGWDEWCITEDAEASLRILKRGYRSLFVNKTYGRGLMPFTFEGLKKQRFRWCFGGIQILKKHWESLMPWASHVDPDNRLTATQRYFYLVGGLQWYNDLLNLVFAAFLVLGGLLLLSPAGVAVRPLAGPLRIIPGSSLISGRGRFLLPFR